MLGYFSEINDLAASRYAATIRKPDQTLALYRTAFKDQDGLPIYRVIALDQGVIEGLEEPADYAATLCEYGEKFITCY